MKTIFVDYYCLTVTVFCISVMSAFCTTSKIIHVIWYVNSNMISIYKKKEKLKMFL